MSTASDSDLLQVKRLQRFFPIRRGFLRRVVGQVRAVDDVSFSIKRGETLSLVGESGCGKTTTARCILRAIAPTSGEILFQTNEGAVIDVATLPRDQLRPLRRQMQMIFQDPYASLNPRMTILEIVGEPLLVHGVRNRRERQDRVEELLRLVGLRPEYLNRFPHAFSGGQRQRVGIARALALEPKVMVLDEPVSALDVSIQAGVVNLLEELQDDLGLAYLFIAHDLSVIRHISDRVAVMYLGKVVETGTRDQIYQSPAHPYTQALLSAVPVPDPVVERQRQRIILTGDVPSAVAPPSGCRFRTRCWKAQDICAEQEPELTDRGQGHPAACHFAESTSVVPRAPQSAPG